MRCPLRSYVETVFPRIQLDEAMFNSAGTSYAAETSGRIGTTPIPSRFVLWFNGNGIPERYWIPAEEGADYSMTPCLSPLAPFRSGGASWLARRVRPLCCINATVRASLINKPVC